MSKSSIKTKTALTMTEMTEFTELQAFKRQKDGYKVTVKISLSLDDKTNDYVDKNTGGRVESLHEVTQLG